MYTLNGLKLALKIGTLSSKDKRKKQAFSQSTDDKEAEVLKQRGKIKSEQSCSIPKDKSEFIKSSDS